MIDKREEILSRLEAILSGLGAYMVVRNPPHIDDSIDNWIALFDGREEPPAERPANQRAGAVVNAAPAEMTMLPEIYIAASEASAAAGKSLNATRIAIVKAIMSDGPLFDLTAEKRSIDYNGCETGFTLGRKVGSGMLVKFAISYTLRIADLS